MLHPKSVALSALLFACGTLFAKDSPSSDLPGSQDHPAISRFAGSLLVGYGQQDWAATELPGPGGLNPKNKRQFVDPLQLEGKRTRLYYLGPQGKTPLEVFRNQQQALQAAGFKTGFACELKACSDPYFALDTSARGKSMDWVKGSVVGVRGSFKGSRWGLEMALSGRDGHMLVGSLSRGGKPLHLLLYTSSAANEYTDRAASFIEIVEPKPMPTGQVTVDAQALGAGLQAEGKVALYGLFFDSGKAELRTDSQPQLAQMLALLKAQPQLKVYIVGHTDNVGTLDANLALSQARAQAVLAALSKDGIAPARMQARGLANLAPLASNAADEGRARNRRVELVLQ